MWWTYWGFHGVWKHLIHSPLQAPFIGLTVHGTAVVNDSDDCFTWLSSPNLRQNSYIISRGKEVERTVGFGGGQQIETPGISSSVKVRHRRQMESRMSFSDFKPIELAKTVAHCHTDRPPGHWPSQVMGGRHPHGWPSPRWWRMDQRPSRACTRALPLPRS